MLIKHLLSYAAEEVATIYWMHLVVDTVNRPLAYYLPEMVTTQGGHLKIITDNNVIGQTPCI